MARKASVKATTPTAARRSSSRLKKTPPPSSSDDSSEEESDMLMDKKPSLKREIATDTTKLVQELIEAHSVLKEMPQQQDDEDENDPVLMQLITRMAKPDILSPSTASSQVQSLAARCFADILFICSPNAPYSTASLKLVFTLLIASLRGLKSIPSAEDNEHSAFACATYVLHKMAICKLSCILASLPENEGGKVKTSQLVGDMFDVVFTSISPKHEAQVELDCIDLLAGYMDEIGEDAEALQIDQLLTPLLPESKRESMRAFDVARGVLLACTVSHIRQPISTFLRGTMLGEFDLDRMAFMQSCSEECTINNQDMVFQVVCELFKINPDLLLFVLPAVETVLEHHEEDTRQKAVVLCCTLFWEMRMQDMLVEEHGKLLEALLSRAFDAYRPIRIQVLKFMCKVLSTAKPQHGTRLIDQILHDDHVRIVELGLKDAAVEIRSECVEIASLALTSFYQVNKRANSHNMAKWLGERLTDISLPIALRAMEGLAWCYSAQPKDFAWIPTMLLTCNAKRDSKEEYRRVEIQRLTLLDNALVGTTAEQRVDRVNLLFSQLDTTKSKQAFKRLAFVVRSQWRDHCLKVLDGDRKYCPSELDSEGEEGEMWRQMWAVKDRAVHDMFRSTLLSLHSTRKEMTKARKEVLEKLGACWQSQKLSGDRIAKLKQFCRDVVFRFACMWTVCSEDVGGGAVLDEQVLVWFIELFPAALRQDQVERILDEGSGLAICTVGCFVDFDALGEEDLALQCKEKVMAVLNDDAALQTVAIKALLRLKHQGELVETFNEKPSNSWTLSELSVMLALCKESSSSSSAAAPVLEEDLIDVLLENVKREYSNNDDEDKPEVDLKLVSVQLLAEYVVSGASGQKDEARTRRIVLMLRSIVADLGDPWQAQRDRQKNKFAPVQWPPPKHAKFALLRIECARALMRIETHLPVAEGEDVATQLKRQGKRIVERSRLAFDPEHSNRQRFAQAFGELEMEAGVNMHRNCAFLCVMVSLAADKKQSALMLQELRAVVKFLGEQSHRAKVKEDEAHATLYAPELILAHLVFILAHHPLFPALEEESDAFAVFLKEQSSLLTQPILVLIEALANAHPKPKELDQSVSFLLGVLAKIRTCRDVLDWENHAVHCVGDLARLVIQQYSIRLSPDSLQVYKGRVPLPRSMYVDIHDSSSSSKHAFTPTAGTSIAASVISPVSYLPAGFDFDSLQVLSHKKKRKSNTATPSSTTKRPRSSSTAKKTPTITTKRRSRSTSNASEDSKDEEPVVKKQLPARAARMSLGSKPSFVESSSSEEEEDDDDDSDGSSD